MSARRGRTARPPRPIRALAASVAVAGCLLAACSTDPSQPAATSAAGGGAGRGAPDLGVPLTTSWAGAGGMWAAIPMGHLDDPANTFWQLLFQPDANGGGTGASAGSNTGASAGSNTGASAGSNTGDDTGDNAGGTLGSWSDQIEATAVATNGGVVAAADGSDVVAGVRPYGELEYSPLIESTDGGRSWSHDLVDRGLADTSDSLAVSSTGAMLALASGGSGPEVLSDDAGVARAVGDWTPLVDEPALAESAGGRACGLLGIDAVAFDQGTPVVAGTCSHPGVVGILEPGGGTWQLDGPELDSHALAGGAFSGRRIEVLGLGSTATGLVALLATGGSPGSRSGPDLVVAARMPTVPSGPGGGTDAWSLSPPTTLPPGASLASIGTVPSLPSGSWFVLERTGGGGLRLLLGAAGTGWRSLPAPPSGTETVVVAGAAPAGAGGWVEALAVHLSVLDVWSLAPGTATWVRTQLLNVPIQYGSSS